MRSLGSGTTEADGAVGLVPTVGFAPDAPEPAKPLEPGAALRISFGTTLMPTLLTRTEKPTFESNGCAMRGALNTVESPERITLKPV